MAAKKPLSLATAGINPYNDDLPSPTSPLDGNRASPVGLGILAALAAGGGAVVSGTPLAVVSPRAVKLEVSELGCSWRCPGGGVDAHDGDRRRATLPRVDSFLSACFLCRRRLDGKDIYMYRGEKAFCSAECRCQQMANDELQESDAFAATAAGEQLTEVAGSAPYSDGRIFFTGVAVA